MSDLHTPPQNDNGQRPRRRLVPLLGVLDTDSGRFTPYKVVELLPHPDDLVGREDAP